MAMNKSWILNKVLGSIPNVYRHRWVTFQPLPTIFYILIYIVVLLLLYFLYLTCVFFVDFCFLLSYFTLFFTPTLNGLLFECCYINKHALPCLDLSSFMTWMGNCIFSFRWQERQEQHETRLANSSERLVFVLICTMSGRTALDLHIHTGNNSGGHLSHSDTDTTPGSGTDGPVACWDNIQAQAESISSTQFLLCLLYFPRQPFLSVESDTVVIWLTKW